MPFSAIELREGAVRFAVGTQQIEVALDTYNATVLGSLRLGETLSPDGRWMVSIHDHNLYVRDTTTDEVRQLTTDGVEAHAYGGFNGPVAMTITRGNPEAFPLPPLVVWSPDSTRFITHRLDQRGAGLMHLVRSSPPDGGDSLPYPLSVPAPVDKQPIRIGLTTTRFSAGHETHPDCARAAVETAQLLERLGHQVEVVEAPRHDLGSVIWDYGVPGASYYIQVARMLDLVGKQLDVLLRPTVPVLTPPISDYLPPPLGTFEIPEDNQLVAMSGIPPLIAFTQIYNWTGQPAISLPLFQGEHNLPVGVRLGAGRLRDDLLLQLAYELEEALPWLQRRPEVCA